MDRLQAMETFVRVVETGSFSSAARQLGLGQPAVSKAVAGLEDAIGARLLVRTTRQLSTTQAGQMFYERARRALSEADEAFVEARGAEAGLDGRLRVCAPVTFARLHIAPRLGTFLVANPKLNLEFVMDDRRIDLVEANIDVALRLGSLADSSLVARKLRTGGRLVVASPAYLQRRGVPSTPDDLQAHDVIAYTQAPGVDDLRFRKGDRETNVQVASRLTLTAAEGVREAIFAGLGLAAISQWMMPDELAAGTVVPVLTDWSLPPVDLWAVFPAGRLPGARARAFVTWFDATFPH
jgi:DNA-binding transcriptional LysR family regulator